MNYGPIGLVKALLETVAQAFNPYPKRKGKPRDSVDDKPVWRIDEADAYDPDDDPGEEWWHSWLEECLNERERGYVQAQEQVIEDYESEHTEETEQTVEKPDTSDEVVENHGIPIDGSGGLEAEQADEDFSDEEHESDSGSEATEVEAGDFSGNSSDDMDSDFSEDFDYDSGIYDGYIG